MNYADFGLERGIQKTGMYDVVRAMKSLAEELGVFFIPIQILKNHC
jgi:phytoene desaturase